MIIRAATARDVPSLTTLLRKSWLTVWAPELKWETVRRFVERDPARAYAETRWREFFVAEEEVTLLGMFHVEAGSLNAIHLDPRRKRQGIGTQLMDEAERRIAKNHDHATLEVRAFNRAAIAFYRQRGWRDTRTYLDNECGEDVLTIEMTKKLTSGSGV